MSFITNFFQDHKETIIDGLLLFFLMIIFFSRWIFLDRYLLFALDLVQDFSIHHFAAFSWSQGVIPIWDPYFFGSVIGYLNSGLFYPFNLLTDFLQILIYQDLNYSYLLVQANLFFHFFLASFLMYLLVRKFVSSRIIALTAGIIFAYSGYMVKEYLHIAYLQGAVWLPLFFLFFYKSVFEKKNWLKFSILTGIVFAVSLFAGQTQPAIYFLFLLFLFSSYAAYYFWQTKEEKIIKPFLSFLIVILVTIGLFAIQFFPTWEYKKYSARETMEYSYAIDYSAEPLYFVFHSFVPSFWGTMQSKTWDGWNIETLPLNDRYKWLDTFWGGLPNEMTFYLGLLPFFLLPFAALTKNKFLRNFLFLLLFASILLMLAKSMPLVGRLYWYLLGGIARVPIRAAILWSFSLSFLAALGLQALIDLKETRKELFDKIIKINFLIFGALIFVFFPILVSLLLSQAGKPTMPYFLFPMLNGFSLFLLYFLIYSVLIFCFVKLQETRLVLFLITLFTVVDIFSFHMGNTHVTAGNAPEHIIGTVGKPEISYLKNDKDFFRVTGLGLAAYANNLFSLGYGTTGLSGFAYRPALELYSIIADDVSPLYDLLNVKYFYALEGKLRDLTSSVGSSTFLSDHRPYDAFDGNAETEWVVDPKTQNKEKDWIGVTFRKLETLARVEFLGRDNDLDKEIKDLDVMFSDGSSQKLTLPSKKGWKVMEVKPTKTEWVKFIFEDFDLSGGKNDSYGLREVNIINSAGEKVEIGSPKFEKVPGTNLYLNKTVLSRVFTTYGYKSFKDRNEMFTAILSDQTGEDMRQNVYLYRKILGFNNPQNFSVLPSSSAAIKEYKLKKVTVEANMAVDGFLVLGDVWYPGWKAFIDGRQTNLFSAYHALRAVQVPQGKHTVVFRYDPLSFKIGATITLGTIGILAIYFLLPIFVKKPKK